MFRGAVFLLAVLQLSLAQQFDWPKQYSVSGQIILPYGGIAEPFTATVDMTGVRSRIDYYGGSAVIINLGNQDPSGLMFKIVPETTQDFANVMTCFRITGGSGSPVEPQSVLPNMSNYKYVADYMYNGVQTEVYMSSYSEGPKNNNYTLLVKKDDKTPIILYFRGYDRLFGSHYDEYVIKYNGFITTINQSVFDYQNKFDCKSFPGPGASLAMAENPMFEFVGAKSYEDKHRSFKVDSEFEDFKGNHGRKYETEGEEAKRKTHFRHNHRYINSINRQNLSYKLKVNHMTDFSDNEFKTMRGYRHTEGSPRGELYTSSKSVQGVPESFNWRLNGAVTPVKDQGICGSCWSFGTTGTLEGSYFIKYGKLVSFSEQALVDCSWGYGNNGCDGGESERAYKWIIDNKCMPTEDTYGGGRYLMQDGYCMLNQSTCGLQISKFYNTKSGDVDALVSAIAENGPISVAIDASHKSFSFYSHGVYFEPECGNGPDSLDHQVLAVGYGTLTPGDNNTQYWYIKNSWSTHWGNDGYVLMSRRDNNCGVATDASFAVISDK